MIVGWRDGCFLQKSGVCNGSCEAPVLSDIYLGVVDCAIESTLESTRVNKAAHYVDDFLVAHTGEWYFGDFYWVWGGLRFTYEVPQENVLPCLDLSLHLGDTHVCWLHWPESKKRIWDYSSAHSNIVKRGIALTCLGSALKNTCFQTMGASFTMQIGRDSEKPAIRYHYWLLWWAPCLKWQRASILTELMSKKQDQW